MSTAAAAPAGAIEPAEERPNFFRRFIQGDLGELRVLIVLAIICGIAVGLGIGFFQGFMFNLFGIPSFVVTLAGLLAWQGFLLKVLGSTGTVNLTDSTITGLTGTFYSGAVGWV